MLEPRIVFVCLALVGCHKSVPAEVQPALDSVRADARAVAAAAAKTCGDQFASGRFAVKGGGCSVNVLPGETVVPTIPSPAKGTALDGNAFVADVQTMCSAPTCGMGLDSLHTPALRNLNEMPIGATPTTVTAPKIDVGVAESTCKKSPSDCEEVTVPSRFVANANTADLRIVKPVAGGPPGATVEVVIVLAKK